MTERDHDVLNAIQRFTAARKKSPSVRELAIAVNVSSSSTVHGHLARLKRVGKITWEPGAYRSIIVLGEAA